MKNITMTTVAALLLGTAGAFAQNTSASATTAPVGFNTITIPAAPGAGQSSLSGISFGLRNETLQTGQTSAIGASSVTSNQAGWAQNQWSSEAHLLYVTDSNGAEEAYLIMSNTSETITVDAPFDLTDRYGSGARTFSIVRAHTFGSVFGNDTVMFQTGGLTDADLIYVWSGEAFVTYFHNGTSWRRTGSFANVNGDVIFPDDGMFILRRGTSELNLVITGSVPIKPQISTIPTGGLTMVGSRYPVGTTISGLGFANLPNWQAGTVSTGDRFFIWNGTAWVTYFFSGSEWRRSGTFASVDDEVVPANSMIFVSRVESSGAPDPSASANVHVLPYNLNN